MTDQPLSARASAYLLPAATMVLAGLILAADLITPPDCVVCSLYAVVILMATRFCTARGLWMVAAGCTAATIFAQVVAYPLGPGNEQMGYVDAFNSAISIVTTGLTTYLVLRGREAEADLRRSQGELARVSRVTVMGELAASIAHDVNQPIAAVVTNAGACLHWLDAETPDLGEARDAAHRIIRDGGRAAEIIARIRRLFARSDEARAAVDLNQLIRETLDLLQVELRRYACTARVELERDLPPVSADRIELQQVLVNLIQNAAEANKDAPTREIVVKSRCSVGSQVVIAVSDTGPGLSPQNPEQIFDAFVTTKPNGIGMGLSISRSIIESHQGRLWATANRPRGATFQFAIPVARGGNESPRA